MRSAMLIRVGMPVYGVDEALIGPVEGLDGAGVHVGGHHIPSAAIARVSAAAIYLRIVGVMYGALAHAPEKLGLSNGTGATRAEVVATDKLRQVLG